MKLSMRVIAVFIENVRLLRTELEYLTILVMWHLTMASLSPLRIYDN